MTNEREQEMQANEEAMANKFLQAMLADEDERQWRDADAYQRKAMSTCVVEPGDVRYFALGLTGEAGEVADKIKKLFRDDDGKLTVERRDGLVAELGDVAWYLACLSNALGVTFGEVLAGNVKKLEGRAAAGSIKGDGDVR